jgi:hypothetical protein
MAILALTASSDILGALPSATFPLSVVGSTAVDNGDGTWTVTAETDESNIAALQALGCTVVTAVSDADQIALWDVVSTQIDNEPPVA